MIGTIDVEIQAANPNMPLYPMRAFAGSPSSIRVRNVPKRIGDWCIRSVYLNAIYPDGTIKSASCVLTGGIWVGTIEGTATTGTSMNGYTIFADGTDENGNTVTGYVLGKGDIYILDSNGQLNPDAARYVVRMLSAESATPLEGDFWPVDGTWYIWQNGEAKQVGVSQADVDAMISAKADLSDLEEVEYSLSDYALSSQIPLSVSQLENDSGYITSAQVEPLDRPLTSGYAKKSWNAALLDAWGADNLPSENSYAQAYANYNTATDSWNFDIKCQCYIFASFNLTKLFEETFLPAIQLKWCYQTIWRNRGGRWSKSYTGWMWLAAGQYAITASENGTPDGNFYFLYYADATHQNCINDPATDVHTVEFSQSVHLISAITIDGQAGQITCYRSDGYDLGYVRDVAFEDELSTKADLSALEAVENSLSDYYTKSETSSNVEISTALALKQDKLSNAQISSINSVVDERTTYFTFPNNEVQSVYVEGMLNTYYLEQLNPELSHEKILTATEVKIGTAVTGIDYSAFNGCSNLVKVTIPDSVVTIGEYAFAACYALVRLEIPDGVSTINNLFNYTDVHADIVFGKGVQSISQGMFHYVSPASVTFKGKTLAEVQAMADYPWDIEDTSIIKTYNIATQEWVLEQLSALEARIAALENN